METAVPNCQQGNTRVYTECLLRRNDTKQLTVARCEHPRGLLRLLSRSMPINALYCHFVTSAVVPDMGDTTQPLPRRVTSEASQQMDQAQKS